MSDVRNDISGTRPIDNPAVSSREKGILLLLATFVFLSAAPNGSSRAIISSTSR